MSVSDIFTLNNPIAPRLIRILYVVALVLISIGVVAGVARGIAGMVRPPIQRIAVIGPRPPTPPPAQVAPPAPVAPAADAAAPAAATPPVTPVVAAAPNAPQVAPAPPPGPRAFGRRGFRGDGMGPRFERRMDGGRAPMILGVVRILGTLVAGLIAVMVVRILAEMATAVLKMGEKA